MTKHQNLQVLGAITSGQQGEQPDRPAQRQVGDLRQHQGDLCGVMVEASQYRPQPSANSQLISYNRVSAPHEVHDLVGRLAAENPTWGTGGFTASWSGSASVSASTVWPNTLPCGSSPI